MIVFWISESRGIGTNYTACPTLFFENLPNLSGGCDGPLPEAVEGEGLQKPAAAGL